MGREFPNYEFVLIISNESYAASEHGGFINLLRLVAIFLNLSSVKQSPYSVPINHSEKFTCISDWL